MKLKRLVVSMVLAVFAAAQGIVVETPEPQRPLVDHLSNQDRAPAFSSPQEEMAPNGDRVSPYPPYYRPERSNR